MAKNKLSQKENSDAIRRTTPQNDAPEHLGNTHYSKGSVERRINE